MPTVSTLATAMFGVEGNNPNLAGNNNPGNLVYAGQAGAAPGAGGFAAFPSLAAGQAAAEAQINLDLTRGSCATGAPISSLLDLINCWAPASGGNNPSNYAATVASATGLDVNSPLAAQLQNGGMLEPSDDGINSLDQLITGDSSLSLTDLMDPSQPWLYVGLAGIGLVWYMMEG